MNENENNFESLRRLLALKRHEIPPPGYFENFSSEVTARIRAGETGGTVDSSNQLSWWFRLLSAFETKPAFAGGFACALCLLLLFGIVYAERPDVAPPPLLTTMLGDSPAPVVMPDHLGDMAKSVSLSSLAAEQPALIPINSTNPVFNSQAAGSLFASQGAAVQEVSFRLPGN